MSFFIINDIRLNLPMGWVPFQMLYLGSFSNVRCIIDGVSKKQVFRKNSYVYVFEFVLVD